MKTCFILYRYLAQKDLGFKLKLGVLFICGSKVSPDKNTNRDLGFFDNSIKVSLSNYKNL